MNHETPAPQASPPSQEGLTSQQNKEAAQLYDEALTASSGLRRARDQTARDRAYARGAGQTGIVVLDKIDALGFELMNRADEHSAKRQLNKANKKAEKHYKQHQSAYKEQARIDIEDNHTGFMRPPI